ncbi:MAG: hypothetical protein Q8880_02915 [Bacteroidota bacterium]|nr:hypothetical protein [Bacteroidota bacterium]
MFCSLFLYNLKGSEDSGGIVTFLTGISPVRFICILLKRRTILSYHW